MAFETRIVEEGDQALILGIFNGREVWQSRMTAEIDPVLRLNLDFPEAVDHRLGGQGATVRWRLATREEAVKLGWRRNNRDKTVDDSVHFEVAAGAVARFLVDGGEAATILGKTKSEVDALAVKMIEEAVEARKVTKL